MKRRKRRVVNLGPDKYFSDEQLGRLLQYARAEAKRGGLRAAVNLIIVELLLCTAARASELVVLKMCDLPHCHGKNAVRIWRGKGNVQRTLENLSPELSERITNFVKKYRKGTRPGSPLFVAEGKSTAMSYHSLYHKLKSLGERAGVTPCKPHMFRHTALGRLYAGSHDPILVRDFGGHASIKTTEIYINMFDPGRAAKISEITHSYFANL